MRSRPSSGAISSRRDAEYARNRTLLPLATGSCLRLIKGRYASQLEGQGGYLGKSTNPGGGLSQASGCHGALAGTRSAFRYRSPGDPEEAAKESGQVLPRRLAAAGAPPAEFR
jgi:hypothetical protein